MFAPTIYLQGNTLNYGDHNSNLVQGLISFEATRRSSIRPNVVTVTEFTIKITNYGDRDMYVIYLFCVIISMYAAFCISVVARGVGMLT